MAWPCGEDEGHDSVGRARKRWIDRVKDFLRKRKFGSQAGKENDAG